MRQIHTPKSITPVCMALVLFVGNLYAQRTEENFNRGWRFAKGEQGEQVQQLDFDDSAWQALRLPHDWAISGPFNPNENGDTGKLPWKGVGWYRKTFTLAEATPGQRVYFDFDGVMAFPKVYVNGQLAGEWNYGYMSFRVDATPYVKFGEANVIAVNVDTRRHSSRWYPGAGIYRKVMMTICNPVHMAHNGVFVTTPKVEDAEATVHVSATIENHLPAESKISVEMTVLDPDGSSVATLQKDAAIAAGGTGEINQSLTVPAPQRWDVTSPKLYTLKTTVRRDGKVVDSDVESFGIRTFEFTANDGFHLNGRRVQIYGANLHHDHGPLGAAFNRRAMQRQLEIMQDMGVNAIRTSHNPSAPELLELCDRMGLVVWNECFDAWDRTAGRVNDEPPLEEHGEKQLRNFVMRDRNHPSVVVWSVGNEIRPVEHNKNGKAPEEVAFMRETVRKYDSTRPVAMGCCVPSAVKTKALGALDMAGWNYSRRYVPYRELYPNKPIVYSESASTLSTRGFYELPLPSCKKQYSQTLQVCSYDMNAAYWSDIPDVEFKLMEQDRFVAGEMVWTGFDYLGEPTPFAKEARSSYFGIVDLVGIPKDRFFLYRSYWRPETTTVHILPHWNWPDYVGRKVPVFVYTNGDSAELFLNGKSLGRRVKGELPAKPENDALGNNAKASSAESENGVQNAVDMESSYYEPTYQYRLRWNDVVYEPGELKAIAYKDGKKIGEAVMRTAGKPASVRLTPDRTVLSSTGEDLAYILVEALDEKGTLCPLAEDLITFDVQGPAEIAGVGNGNPLSLEPFQANSRKLFYGKAMLILRSVEGPGGQIRVTARGEGLKAGQTELRARDERF